MKDHEGEFPFYSIAVNFAFMFGLEAHLAATFSVNNRAWDFCCFVNQLLNLSLVLFSTILENW